MNRRERGRQAESRALRHLENNGLTLLCSNYRSRRGEIDLVMLDHDSLVFVEVRYRHSPHYGSPAESVDRNKQARLIACAQHYLLTHPQSAQQPCRFDVVSVNGNTGTLDWIRHAFVAE